MAETGGAEETGGKGNLPDAGLTEVGQIAVTVQEVERATAFYRDVLGVPFLFDAPGLAFFDLGGIRLMLSRPEGVEPSSSVLYFRAADIQASYETLLGHGVEFREAPHVVHRTDDYELSMAFFDDSEGNVMAIMNETGTL
jgi:methylmalonyl-CoA/ethylmalonyl-CoA epimerase